MPMLFSIWSSQPCFVGCWAWDQHFRIVDCQTDSLDTLTLVKSVPSFRHEYASLTWDVKDLLDRSWKGEIHHALREENGCADFLAKHDPRQGEYLVRIVFALEGLSPLLLAGAMGTSLEINLSSLLCY